MLVDDLLGPRAQRLDPPERERRRQQPPQTGVLGWIQHQQPPGTALLHLIVVHAIGCQAR
ncbi:hypothetical protein ABZ922_41745 [Streptomyces shenzhenensis]|uniref:hypothetical protein n=1 Tax=Streptomyces shenzhenensis TaxID=943815 RepID=UPI003400F551